MYCNNCGTEIKDGSAFCINCGQTQENTAAPAPKKGKAATWIFAALSLLLAVALVIVLVLPGVSGTSSKGFDTPEAAIEYFIGCINEGDVAGALATSYAEKAAENYDFEAMADRLQCVQFHMLMPTEYEFYREMNLTTMKSQLLTQIRAMVISLTQPEYASVITEGMPLILEDSADYEGLDPTLEEPIEIVEIEEPIPEMYNSEANQNNMKKMQKVYGADDIEWRAVLYKYDGDYYVGGYQLMEYDSKWYIQAAQEILIGQPAFGTLMPIDDKSDFDGYTE